jgi:hypothetical protein
VSFPLRGRFGRRLALIGAACVALSAGPLCAHETSDAPSGFAAPSHGEILAPGALVEIRWTAECEADRGREENEAELVLSLDGGLSFPIRVSGDLSPCDSRFTWRVPALPTAQAVLGVRMGEDERDEEERIEVVSEAFTILPDPESRIEALYARGAEWWIPEPPSRRGAEDGLRTAMHGASSHFVASIEWTEAAIPGSSSASPRFERFSRLPTAHSVTIPASTVSLVSAPAAPTPLRC